MSRLRSAPLKGVIARGVRVVPIFVRVAAIALCVASPFALAQSKIPVPNIAAKSYVLMDYATGRVLAEQ